MFAIPASTMADYFPAGGGFGVSLLPPPGKLPLRIDASWTHFGQRSVDRPLNGTGPNINITSSASIVQALVGPVGTLHFGGWSADFAAQGGGAYVLSTGSTVLPGDPQRLDRSNTYTTVTWALAGSADIGHTVGAGRLAAGFSVRQLGKTDFLREYNLPIGVISGIYLNPTPYSPLFMSVDLRMTFPL